MRFNRNGKLTVGLIDKESADKFKAELKGDPSLAKDYTVRDANKGDPRIRFAVPKRYKEEKSIEIDIHRNPKVTQVFPTIEEFKKEFKIFRHEPTGPRLKFVAARVSPKMYKCLTDLKGGISLDMELFKVQDYLESPQCYRCQRFGHTATKKDKDGNVISSCKKIEACSHCGGNHSFDKNNKCQEPESCINCERHNAITKNKGRMWTTNHSVRSKDCLYYLSTLESKKLQTNYIQS